MEELETRKQINMVKAKSGNLGYLALCIIILQKALVDTSNSGSPMMRVLSVRSQSVRLILAGTVHRRIVVEDSLHYRYVQTNI